MNKRLTLGLRIVVFFMPLTLCAQDLDIHWSQYYNAPFYVNPALTGVFSGDKRLSGNYRNQWFNVPVTYETIAIAYDQKFYAPRMRNGLFGAGLHILSDQAGASKMRTFQVALSGSYTHKVASSYYLTVGGQGAFNNRRYDTGGLTFDSQFDGNEYQPGWDPGEVFLNTNFSFATVGAGINLHQQKSARTWFDLGGGWFNINTPRQKFNETRVYDMKARYTGYFNGGFKIGGPLDLMARGLAMFQGPNYESLAGLGIKFHFNELKTREFAMSLGVDYRFNDNDAWAPVIGVDYRRWRAAFSYDLNVSDFREATNLNGGPELSIQYIITTVKPLAVIKSCPVY